MSRPIAITALALANEHNEVYARLVEAGYSPRLHTSMVMPDPAELRELLDGAAGVIAGSEPYPRELMLACPALRVISRNGVGYDAIDVEAATELGIVVAFTPDAMVDAVADLTIGLLLAAGRRICELDGHMKRGEWRRTCAADFTGRTLGIIGTGRIGQAVARRARAFRMRLLGYDPYPNPLFVEELGGDYVSLDELLETSDYLSLHVPSTPESRGMIGTAQLARVKPSAYLVNTARGTLVDEQALLLALEEGRLAGAALDVFADEPPRAGTPGRSLAVHPRVVALPHVGAYTPQAVARMGRGALENLLAVLEGRRPAHMVNPGVFERGLRVG